MAVDNTKYNVPFRAPALPYPPQVYDQQSFEEFNKVLRIYFNQLDNALRNVMLVQQESLTWIDYVTGFTSEPTLTQTISTGDVYTYTYPNTVLYRLVPSGLEQDAFYSVFSGGVLSVLVATKGITI